ncbi:MAG: hypothetical protein WB868_21510 [Xanthobacteraceae bacterium]
MAKLPDARDAVTRSAEARNRQICDIDEKLERWHRKLTRAVNAIDMLRKARKRILKPKAPAAPLTVAPAEYYKIRETDFGDTLADL